ncbi:MAG: hypothetical protein KatS3mg035_1717 [Bacteroidia bacterium]|nr:MAG: hypothetical protein KatS3mg035_1717 [Bacteroidia bacterium]
MVLRFTINENYFATTETALLILLITSSFPKRDINSKIAGPSSNTGY